MFENNKALLDIHTRKKIQMNLMVAGWEAQVGCTAEAEKLLQEAFIIYKNIEPDPLCWLFLIERMNELNLYGLLIETIKEATLLVYDDETLGTYAHWLTNVIYKGEYASMTAEHKKVLLELMPGITIPEVLPCSQEVARASELLKIIKTLRRAFNELRK